MDKLYLVILLHTLLYLNHGYPRGAPRLACEKMIPDHSEVNPESTKPPFSVVHSTNGNITVTIKSETGEKFKGFFLQARLLSNKSHIQSGKFMSGSNTNFVDCAGPMSALTHNSAESKEQVTTQWIPPDNFEGDIIFRATVVKEFTEFWANIDSDSVHIDIPKKTSVGINKELEAQVVSEEATSNIPPEGQEFNISSGLYQGCGVNKGCFGLPSGCVEKMNCEVVLTYIPLNESIKFTIVGATGSSPGWIAMGLSTDKYMGDDSVTECVQLTPVVVRQSWNVDTPRKGNQILDEVPEGFSEESGEYEEGIITCSWNRAFVTTVRGNTYDLANNNYYILLAKGPINDQGVKGIHSKRLRSLRAADLTSATVVLGKIPFLIKIHGSLMVVAWLGFISIGIIIARYYKEVWSDVTLCNTKLWFAIHRGLMLLSVATILAAFIAIFIYEDGWSKVAPNPHPILGIIATGLAVLQPILAAFRPKPSSPKRPIFRWLHGLVGNGAQIIAVATMFFAVSLVQANLPKAFYWVLTAFVILHLLFHLMTQLVVMLVYKRRVSDNESESRMNQFHIMDEDRENPGHVFRKIVLIIYGFVNGGFVLALVLMVCLS